MYIHSIDLIHGKQRSFRIRKRTTTFGIVKGELRQHRSKYHLRVLFDGYNLIVTDQGAVAPILLAGQPLVLNSPQVWSAGQELLFSELPQPRYQNDETRSSNYLLTWESERPTTQRTSSANRGHGSGFQFNPANLSLLGRIRALPSFLLTSMRLRFATPMERIAPRLSAILIALIFAAIITFLWRLLGNQRGDIDAVAVEIPPTTAMSTPTNTPEATQTPIRTPIGTLNGTPTVVRIANLSDVPPSTVEATQTQVAVLASSVTNTPIPCLVPTPLTEGIEWDPNLTELEIELVRTCAKPGQKFWQLVRARWLDPAESNGYHHVFVDVINEEGQRVLQPPVSFVMRWPTDECKRYITGRGEPFGHGEHCAMFAPGKAYDVTIQGLPSDVVRGLGLGTPEQREWRILGSYHLVFQRKTLTQ